MIFAKIIIASIEAIPAFAIVLIFYNAFIAPFTRKKQMEKAIQEGRGIVAKLESYKMPEQVDGDYPFAYDAYCTYVFDYKGKSYKYHKYSSKIPPAEEYMVFFKKNPKKATDPAKFGTVENKIRHVFIPVWFLLIIFNVLFVKI